MAGAAGGESGVAGGQPAMATDCVALHGHQALQLPLSSSSGKDPALKHLTVLGAPFTSATLMLKFLLSSSLPGVQPGAGALHLPLPNRGGGCAAAKEEGNEEESAQEPSPTLLSHERPE